ncbi:MAG: hypothetical protein A2X11_03575 [Bacteroidetes bacterium GWE2_42_24]|nr:MAG: hypothetical protein A2X11_03575 [Bacteroidetes bacterium GWE2_42_24]OFY32696.1 MAG: hypothetical protein A2X09_06545 [Bacteroidetes bacterium GWF2_43_11]
MKQDSTIFDNQINQMLSGHTTNPSPALRDVLMSKLAATTPRKKAWYMRRSSLWLAAAFLLLPASIYLFSIHPLIPVEVPVEITGVQPAATVPTQAVTAKSSDSKPVITNERVGSSIQDQGNVQVDYKKTNSQVTAHLENTTTKTDVQDDEILFKPQKDEQQLVVTKTDAVISAGPEISETSQLNDCKPFNFSLHPIEFTPVFYKGSNPEVPALISVRKPVRSRLLQDDIPQSDNFSRHIGKFSLGVSYTPEIMFNVLDGDQKFVHNAALELLFHYHDFTIRTGAGLAFAKGTSAIGVKYNSFKGSYQHLDSLDFYYDNETGQVVGIYHLSERNVYDSVSQNVINEIDKRYTYLQIPLLFGYRFFEQNRFGISVNAGPTLSILLSTKETSNYDPGRNLIINTTTLSPDRIKTNWQFSAGLGFSYHLTPKLYIEMEPRVKYYFNSVYEKASATRKPWSFELRSGLLYTL